MEVYIPVGERYETRIRYPHCPVVIEDQDFNADLIELPIKDYDVILGMDWLFQHHAVVDCHAKIVKLGTGVGISTLTASNNGGIPIVLAIKVRQRIRKGGQGFLTYVINKP